MYLNSSFLGPMLVSSYTKYSGKIYFNTTGKYFEDLSENCSIGYLIHFQDKDCEITNNLMIRN